MASAMRVSLLLATMLFVAACGSGDDHNPTGGDGTLPPGGLPTCSDNATGCPCSTPGQTTECKEFRKSGDYIACSIGTRTCGADGKWGDCQGTDQVAP